MTQAIPPAPSASDRVAALDGVRGLAILLVVVMHGALAFFANQLPSAERLAPDHPWVRLALLGWCGVDVFFVLSGFLITGILLRSKGSPHYFRNFYARRALRIFPLYYVVVVLLLWVLPRSPTTPAQQLAHLFYYQNFRYAFGDCPADLALVVTWSLAIEEQFYLMWPAVVRFLAPRALLAWCGAIVVTAIGLRAWLATSGVHTHFFLPCRMDGLAAGAVLALVPLPPAWFGRLAALAGALALAGIAFANDNSFPETPVMQRFGLVAALAFATGVLVLARGDGAFARLCRTNALRSLGRYSYCVYLVHFLVIEACGGALRRAPGALTAHLPALVVLIVFTACCVVASWGVGFLSWHLFETHFLACKRFFSGTAAKA